MGHTPGSRVERRRHMELSPTNDAGRACPTWSSGERRPAGSAASGDAIQTALWLGDGRCLQVTAMLPSRRFQQRHDHQCLVWARNVMGLRRRSMGRRCRHDVWHQQGSMAPSGQCSQLPPTTDRSSTCTANAVLPSIKKYIPLRWPDVYPR